MQAELTISKGSIERTIGNAQMLRELHPASVEIDDPVYGKRKRYAGYWLMDVFRLAGVQIEPGDVWTFQALDGYEARISAADALASKVRPFLAIRDLDASSGWERLRQGKAWISPGPFYLVWQEAAGGSATGLNKSPKLPWPYQLVSVRFRNRDEAQRKLFPGDSSTGASVARGFTVFQQDCLACHSLNLEGGTLGPELNVPRNIMQYRERSYLREFIGNPSSFRARSKMPAFKDSIPANSMDDLFSYLEWIGGHQIQPE
jgi:mono/diheme cytochrome c family protein